MRRGLVALLVLAAACDTQYGAYFVIQSDVEIDRVELYFGTQVDSSGSGSGDQFATPTFGQQSGLVFGRTFDASDIAMTAPVLETTYYVPPTDTSHDLGAYVAAVAFKGDKPVGIAEYFDFAVPTDEVHKYTLKLVPWEQQQVERWGGAPGCLVWKRTRADRDDIVAVVRADDRDCDAMARDVDCNDLCSGTSPACASGFCNVSGTCALGCTRSGLCAATMCLPELTCSDSECAQASTVAEKLLCGLNKVPAHLELVVDRNGALGGMPLCATALMFRPEGLFPCKDPNIEVMTGDFKAMFTPTVEQSPMDPSSCVLKLNGPATTIGSTDQHHALISVASANGVGPRVTFIIGLAWSSSDQCIFEGYRAEGTASGNIFDCN